MNLVASQYCFSHRFAFRSDASSSPRLGGARQVAALEDSGFVAVWVDARMTDTSSNASTSIYMQRLAGAAATPGWFAKRALPVVVETDPSLQSLIYPNPVSTNATVVYECSDAGPTSITVYDVLGAQVGAAYDAEDRAGIHTWMLAAAGMRSGVYFCRVTHSGRTDVVALRVLK